VVEPTEETKRARNELMKQVRKSNLRLRPVETNPEIPLHSQPCLTWVKKISQQPPPPPPPSPSPTVLHKKKKKHKNKNKSSTSSL
jgi:hypothetical protein